MIGKILAEALKAVVRSRGAQAAKYLKPGVDAVKQAGGKVAERTATAAEKTKGAVTNAANKVKETAGNAASKTEAALDKVAEKVVGESKTVTRNVDASGRERFTRTADGKPVTKYTAERYASMKNSRKEAVKEDLKKGAKTVATAATVATTGKAAYDAAKDLKVGSEAKAEGPAKSLVDQIPNEFAPKAGTASDSTAGVQGGDENNAGGTGEKKAASAKKKKEGTFSDAFAAARKDGKDMFEYAGKMYSTATKDDVQKAGAKDLKEYLAMKKSAVSGEFEV